MSSPRCGGARTVTLRGVREGSVAVGGGAKGSGCGVVYAHNVGVGSTRGEFTIDFSSRGGMEHVVEERETTRRLSKT